MNKGLNAVLVLLDPCIGKSTDLPYEWEVFIATSVSEYEIVVKNKPIDIAVLYSSSNKDLNKVPDSILINRGLRGGVKLIVLLTNEQKYPLPVATLSELVIYINIEFWSFKNGRLDWVSIIEHCRRASEVCIA